MGRNHTMKSGQIVVFKLQEYEFGIDIKKVVEILNYEPVRPVPEVPRYVEGIINVRGTIYPIFNLCKRLNMNECKEKVKSKFILLQIGENRVGFLVDSVAEILNVEETCIEELPSMLDRNHVNCIETIVKLKDRMIIVLDVDILISDEEKLFVQGVSDEENCSSNTK